jgi:hypothetical protein
MKKVLLNFAKESHKLGSFQKYKFDSTKVNMQIIDARLETRFSVTSFFFFKPAA